MGEGEVEKNKNECGGLYPGMMLLGRREDTEIAEALGALKKAIESGEEAAVRETCDRLSGWKSYYLQSLGMDPNG